MSTEGKVAPILAAPTPALPPPAPVAVKLRMVQKVVERLQRGVKEVVLCDTKLTDEDVAQLAAEVKKTGDITSLSLFGCQVSESAAKALANALASHQSLTMLDLGRNKLRSAPYPNPLLVCGLWYTFKTPWYKTLYNLTEGSASARRAWRRCATR